MLQIDVKLFNNLFGSSHALRKISLTFEYYREFPIGLPSWYLDYNYDEHIQDSSDSDREAPHSSVFYNCINEEEKEENIFISNSSNGEKIKSQLNENVDKILKYTPNISYHDCLLQLLSENRLQVSTNGERSVSVPIQQSMSEHVSDKSLSASEQECNDIKFKFSAEEAHLSKLGSYPTVNRGSPPPPRSNSSNSCASSTSSKNKYSLKKRRKKPLPPSKPQEFLAEIRKASARRLEYINNKQEIDREVNIKRIAVNNNVSSLNVIQKDSSAGSLSITDEETDMYIDMIMEMQMQTMTSSDSELETEADPEIVDSDINTDTDLTPIPKSNTMQSLNENKQTMSMIDVSNVNSRKRNSLPAKLIRPLKNKQIQRRNSIPWRINLSLAKMNLFTNRNEDERRNKPPKKHKKPKPPPRKQQEVELQSKPSSVTFNSDLVSDGTSLNPNISLFDISKLFRY